MKRNKIASNYKVSIIPEPVKIILEKEIFTFNEKMVIFTDLRLKKIAELLKKILAQATSLNPDIEDLSQIEKMNNVITLRIIDNEKNLKYEGYNLKVSQNCIDISALTPTGIFYGVQTLRQLFPPEIESLTQEKLELSIPCVRIEDFPRFTWRGFMLDEARHFFGKDVVKKVLDLMSFLKLNKFHWHLTDDQGWRIGIKKYPLLTEVGSKRKGTFISKRKGI
ncbi:MAG: family 20 glycosylhydrolase, partial [Candidatus Lokiarchaeota archaeon]|nr:family 20 glycosylhydrolase [Candidatus Lokiarchaeota archaeon]